MANFAFSTKLEILPPKIDMKNTAPKMRKAMNAAIVEGTIKASAYVQRDLKAALDAAMDYSGWAWINDTRDIVDTGKLKKSLVLAEKNLKTKTTIEIKYRSPYANMVHYGGYFQPYGNKNANSILYPARPWVEATLRGGKGIEKFNMSTAMNAGFNEVWARKFG
jgi:hypothetical protein